ncbi:MAG: DUF7144 family membrane protein [Gemmatimonadales bacterium]
MAYQTQPVRGVTAGHETLSGWVVGFAIFAGVLMIMSGLFQVLQGLAAIIDDDFFVVRNNYAFEVDTSTWGWIHLFTGAVVALAGFGVISGNLWARILGIALALASAVVNFFYIPYYPFWSILIIAVDIVVIWALTQYHAQSDVSMSESGVRYR